MRWMPTLLTWQPTGWLSHPAYLFFLAANIGQYPAFETGFQLETSPVPGVE
jgi:hypothetical protein